MEGSSEADDVAVAGHLIGEFHFQFAEFGDGEFHLHDIGESSWAFVVAGDADDGREDAFSLHAFIAESHLFHGVHASFLHDADVVGVVGYALFVSFVVLDFMFVSHNFRDFRRKNTKNIG